MQFLVHLRWQWKIIPELNSGDFITVSRTGLKLDTAYQCFAVKQSFSVNWLFWEESLDQSRLFSLNDSLELTNFLYGLLVSFRCQWIKIQSNIYLYMYRLSLP